MPDFNTFIYDGNRAVSLTVQPVDFKSTETLKTLINDLDELFSYFKDIDAIKIKSLESSLIELLETQLPINKEVLYRQDFYQAPLIWHQHKTSTQYAKRLVQSDNRYQRHPLRPPMPTDYIYRRYDFDAHAEVSFRVIDLEKDLTRFARWMNDPRVAYFWEQAWSEEKLAEFLKERLADPHIIPLIGEFNGHPFGYIEAYWVSEDRLSPYYDAQDFDRGIHLLVGEQEFRGPKYFNSWIRAISHYLFIDDVRTQRIVLEPRADNERLFNRILPMGYEKRFEFNFPHKRSALLMLTRDKFFTEQW